MAEIKRIDLAEFRDAGCLQEANVRPRPLVGPSSLRAVGSLGVMEDEPIELDPTYCPRCGFLTTLHFFPGDQGCRNAPNALILCTAIFGPPLIPSRVSLGG